ncbi:MAG: hypothetical protein ACJ8LL_07545, partial [Candidatus Udaeobacter sp.]
NPGNFFSELKRRNVYKIEKSCFLPSWWSRSPGSHDAVINVYDVAGKLIEVTQAQRRFARRRRR